MTTSHHARWIDGIDGGDVVHGRSDVIKCVGPASAAAEEPDPSILDVPRRPSLLDHGFGQPVHESLGVNGAPEATMDEDNHGDPARTLGREPQIADIATVWPVPDGRSFRHENRTVAVTAVAAPKGFLEVARTTISQGARRDVKPGFDTLRPNQRPLPGSGVRGHPRYPPLGKPPMSAGRRAVPGERDPRPGIPFCRAARDGRRRPGHVDMANVFDSDVDVKTGRRPHARSERVPCGRFLS